MKLTIHLVTAIGLDYFDGIESNYDAIAEHTSPPRGDARHIFRARSSSK